MGRTSICEVVNALDLSEREYGYIGHGGQFTVGWTFGDALKRAIKVGQEKGKLTTIPPLRAHPEAEPVARPEPVYNQYEMRYERPEPPRLTREWLMSNWASDVPVS